MSTLPHLISSTSSPARTPWRTRGKGPRSSESRNMETLWTCTAQAPLVPSLEQSIRNGQTQTLKDKNCSPSRGSNQVRSRVWGSWQWTALKLRLILHSHHEHLHIYYYEDEDKFIFFNILIMMWCWHRYGNVINGTLGSGVKVGLGQYFYFTMCHPSDEIQWHDSQKFSPECRMIKLLGIWW